MIDLGTWSLLAFCSLAGLIIVAGSVFLLWKQRIYLDKEGSSVSAVELPMGIRVKTQYPVLILFLFGAALLSLPAYYSYHTRHQHYQALLCPSLPYHQKEVLQMVKLDGTVASDADFKVFAVVDTKDATAGSRVNLDLQVPFIKNHRYFIKYADALGRPLPGEDFVLDEWVPKRPLQGFDLRVRANNAPAPAAAPAQQVEPSSSVAEFK